FRKAELAGQFGQCAAAVPVEHEDVEQVQRTQDEQHRPDLHGQRLEQAAGVGDGRAVTQPQRVEAQVDQAEADHEQVVDRLGQLLVPVEDLGEEDQSGPAEGAADPDGQGDGDGEIDDVGRDGEVHSDPLQVCVPTRAFTPVLNTFSFCAERSADVERDQIPARCARL